MALSDITRKLFNFGQSGGNKVEYLLAGALGLIIVGALALTIHTSFGGGSRGKNRPIVFECTQCHHHFEQKAEDLYDMEGMYGGMEIPMLDCPSCGAQKSALLTTRCPACEKHFISQSTLMQVQYGASGQMPPEDVRDVCTHCGQDILQWYKDNRRR